MRSEFCDYDYESDFGVIVPPPPPHPFIPPPLASINRGVMFGPTPFTPLAHRFDPRFNQNQFQQNQFQPGFVDPRFDPHWHHQHHHMPDGGAYDPNAVIAAAAWQNLGPGAAPITSTDPTVLNAASAAAPDPSQASSVLSNAVQASTNAASTASQAAQAAVSAVTAPSDDGTGAIDATTGASADILNAGYEFGISHHSSHSSHHRHHRRQQMMQQDGGGSDGGSGGGSDGGDDFGIGVIIPSQYPHLSDDDFGVIPPAPPTGYNYATSQYQQPQSYGQQYPYSGPQTGMYPHHHHHHHHPGQYGQGQSSGGGYDPNSLTDQAYNQNY
jgi:hypothetical protein